MLNYDEFKERVAEEITSYLSDKYEFADVSITEVVKNNGTVLDSLNIRCDEDNISPNIYLNEFYKKYEAENLSMEEILEDIADYNHEHEILGIQDISGINDYDQVKDKIIPKIVNAEMNADVLEKCSHTDLADLTVTYFVILAEGENGRVLTAVTNEMMEKYGITTEELHNTAIANMDAHSPCKFEDLYDTLAAMVADSMFGGDKDMARKALMPDVPEDELKPLYVVSNELGSYGAASILNNNFMDSIKEQIGDDVFMIPSSVHEFIAVPNNDNLSAEELQQMVADVNCNVVAPTDKLSDNVYKYDFDSHELVMADVALDKSLQNDMEKNDATVEQTETVKADISAEQPDNVNHTNDRSDTDMRENKENEATKAELFESKQAKASEEKEMISITVGNGFVSKPFAAKDGNEYRQVSIPNVDEQDNSPWPTFVVKADKVHENETGKSVTFEFPKDGETTVRQDHFTGKDENGKNQYDKEFVSVPNTRLKGMVEAYKTNERANETVDITFAKGLAGKPFEAKDGKEYVQVQIPNRDESNRDPWETFVVPADKLKENEKSFTVELPADGKTTIRHAHLTGRDESGKGKYETSFEKVSNTELKGRVESYKDRSNEKSQENEKRPSLAERIAEKREQGKKEQAERPAKSQDRNKDDAR